MKKNVNGVTTEMSAEEVARHNARQAEFERQYWAIPYGEAVDREIRKAYTLSEELAVLRQKEEKPAEYAKYFSVCEAAKNLVKSKQK